jgi:hypothetical protein
LLIICLADANVTAANSLGGKTFFEEAFSGLDRERYSVSAP